MASNLESRDEVVFSTEQQEQQRKEVAAARSSVKIYVDSESVALQEQTIDAQLRTVSDLERFTTDARKMMLRLRTALLARHSSFFVFLGGCCLLMFIISGGQHMRNRRDVAAVSRIGGVVAIFLRILVHFFSINAFMNDLFLLVLMAVIAFFSLSSDCLTNIGATVFVYLMLVIPEFYLPKAQQRLSQLETPKRIVLGIVCGGMAQFFAMLLAITQNRRSQDPLVFIGGAAFGTIVVFKTFYKAMSVVQAADAEGGGGGGGQERSTETTAATAIESRQELGNDTATTTAAAVDVSGGSDEKAPLTSAPGDDTVLAALGRLRQKQEALQAKISQSNPLVVAAFARLRWLPLYGIAVALLAFSLSRAVSYYRPEITVRQLTRPTVPVPSPPYAYPPQRSVPEMAESNGARTAVEQIYLMPDASRNSPSSSNVFVPRHRRPRYDQNGYPISYSPNQQQQKQQQMVDPYWSLPADNIRRSGCGRREKITYSLQRMSHWDTDNCGEDDPSCQARNARRRNMYATETMPTYFWEKTVAWSGWYRSSKGACTAFVLFAAELLFAAVPGKLRFPRERRLPLFALAVLFVCFAPFWGTEAAIAVLCFLPWVMWANAAEEAADDGAVMVSQSVGDERVKEQEREREGTIARERAVWELVLIAFALAFAVKHVNPTKPIDLEFVVACFAHAATSFFLFKSMGSL